MNKERTASDEDDSKSDDGALSSSGNVCVDPPARTQNRVLPCPKISPMDSYLAPYAQFVAEYARKYAKIVYVHYVPPKD